jgi:hypothetical protein
MEASGQFHAPAAFPWGNTPWFLLRRKLDGPKAGLDFQLHLSLKNDLLPSDFATQLCLCHIPSISTSLISPLHLENCKGKKK